MLDKKLLEELQEYIDSHSHIVSSYKVSNNMSESDVSESNMCYSSNFSKSVSNNSLEDFIKIKRTPPFNKVLFSLIDNIGTNDSDIYKRAGLDRRHFSKIRSNPNYRPSKNTIIALALALRLDKDNTDKLLESAGYALNNCDNFDLVIQFCLEKKIYEIDHVNEALAYFSIKHLLGTEE